MCLTNSSGLRLGIIKKWNNNWFTTQNHYGILLNANIDIKKFFKGLLYYNWKKTILIDIKLNKNSSNKIFLFVFFYKPHFEKNKQNLIFFSKWIQKKIYRLKEAIIDREIQKLDQKAKKLKEKTKKFEWERDQLLYKSKNFKKLTPEKIKEMDRTFAKLISETKKIKQDKKKILEKKERTLKKDFFKKLKYILKIKKNVSNVNKINIFLKKTKYLIYWLRYMKYTKNRKRTKYYNDIEKKNKEIYMKLSFIFYDFLKKKNFYINDKFKDLLKKNTKIYLDIKVLYNNIIYSQKKKKNRLTQMMNYIIYNIYVYINRNKKSSYIIHNRIYNMIKKYELVIWLSLKNNNNTNINLIKNKKYIFDKKIIISYINKIILKKKLNINNFLIKNYYIIDNLFHLQKLLKKLNTNNIYDLYNFKYFKYNIKYYLLYTYYVNIYNNNLKVLTNNNIKILNKTYIKNIKTSKNLLIKSYKFLKNSNKNIKDYEVNDSYNEILKLIKVTKKNQIYKIYMKKRKRMIKSFWPLYSKEKWLFKKNIYKLKNKKKLNLIKKKKKPLRISIKKQLKKKNTKKWLLDYNPKRKKRLMYKKIKRHMRRKRRKKKWWIKKEEKFYVNPSKYYIKNIFKYSNYSKFSKYYIWKNTKKIIQKLTFIKNINIIFIDFMKFLKWNMKLKRRIRNFNRLKKRTSIRNRNLVKDAYNFFNIMLAGFTLKKPILICEYLGKILNEIPKNQVQSRILKFINIVFDKFITFNPEIKGLRIKIKGRFNRRRRSKSYVIKNKSLITNLPMIDKTKFIEYGQYYGIIKNGLVGIKIWIYFDENYIKMFFRKLIKFWKYQKKKNRILKQIHNRMLTYNVSNKENIYIKYKYKCYNLNKKNIKNIKKIQFQKKYRHRQIK